MLCIVKLDTNTSLSKGYTFMSLLRRLNHLNNTVTRRVTRSASTLIMPQAPKINRVSPLSADEAKWTELRKIEVTLTCFNFTYEQH